MVTQHKATGRASSQPSGLAAGAVVSMVVTVIICTLGAWLVTSEILPQEQIGYCSITALLLSAMLGSMAAMNRTKRKRLSVCLMNGGIYYGLLLVITIVFFDGSFQGMGVTLAVVLAGSLAAILTANTGRKQKYNRRPGKI